MNTGQGMIAPQGKFSVIDIKWSWLITLGIIMLILGSIAIIFPAATSVSVSMLVGVLFLIGGAGRLIGMFSSTGWGDFLLKLVMAVVYVVAGLMLVFYPLGGTLTLTLLLGIFFVAQGIVNLVVSLMSAGVSGRGWMLLNGIVSLILGGLIWSELPSSAAWAIGLLVGIWLIFDGWALIMAGVAKHGGGGVAMAQ